MNRMNLSLRALFSRRILINVITLYGVQGCTYLLPLITFPYLARVLKPSGWGAVLFSQAIGAVIAILVEYGFDLSATRETARVATDRGKLQELVAGVLGAKVLLSVLGVAGAVLSRPLISRVAPEPALFWASTFWGVGQGINMLWYFQGLQRMRWAGGLDIAGKIIATLSIFVLVHSPADGWKVMASQAIGCAVSHAITVVVAYREVGFCFPRLPLVWQALRIGWPMFLFRASQSLMTSANGLILGLFGSPTAVGLYAGADKIRQIACQVLWPISQALFPHQSQQISEDRGKSLKMVRTSLALLGGLSLAFGLMLTISAPLLVRLFLGSAFVPAIPTLRLFGVMIPIITVGTVIVFQWMLPLGLDKEFNLVVFTSGILNVAIGIVLASKYSMFGMAMTVVISQMYALLAFEVVLRRRGLSPFSRQAASGNALGVEAAAEPELVRE
jgi:polysaccharide transporter, PST family